MKKTSMLLGMLSMIVSYAQEGRVGINTENPNATLEVAGMPTDISVLDGIIAPKITGDQLKAKTYTANQTGALVYVTEAASIGNRVGQTINIVGAGYYYFDGIVWQIFKAGGIDTTNAYMAGSGMKLEGNVFSRTGLEKVGTGYRFVGSGVEVVGDGAVDMNTFRNDTSGAKGTASFAVGNQNKALGNYAVAMGSGNEASGLSSFAVGTENSVSGLYSSTLGWKNTNSANYSFVSGRNNTNTNRDAFVVGFQNNNSAVLASVFGWNNTSSGAYSLMAGRENMNEARDSFVVGYKNTNKGVSSAVMGEHNISEANYSFVSGSSNTTKIGTMYGIAVGRENATNYNFAVAMGNKNIANGVSSIAMGNNNIVNNFGEVAFGNQNFSTDSEYEYDTTFPNEKQLFSLGNGRIGARSNALIVLRNGKTGIGIASDVATPDNSKPTEMLDVNGNVRVRGNGAIMEGDTCSNNGTISYHNGDFFGCGNGIWKKLHN